MGDSRNFELPNFELSNLELPSLKLPSLKLPNLEHKQEDFPNVFERRLSKALASSEVVFLFDQLALQNEVGEYFSTYYELCEASGREYFEWEGASISEKTLLRGLAITSSQSESDLDSDLAFEYSDYGKICALIETRGTGIFCIHNAHLMSEKGYAILSKLVAHVRRMKLGWQFIIFADAIRVDNIAKLQMSIDSTYPEHLSSDSRMTRQQPVNEPSDTPASSSYRVIVLSMLAVVASAASVFLAAQYL